MTTGWLAVVTTPTGAGPRYGAVLSGDDPDRAQVVELADLPDLVAERLAGGPARQPPRLVWWAAGSDAREIVAAGLRVDRSLDLQQAHALLSGRWRADPPTIWAAAHGLAADAIPEPSVGLFDFASEAVAADIDHPTDAQGYLRPDLRAWLADPAHLPSWGRATIRTAAAVVAEARRLGPRVEPTLYAESAAAVLALELERDGLPIDRPVMLDLIAASAGPRPTTRAGQSLDAADSARAERDGRVLSHVPGRERTDLRNPAAVRDLLAAVGVVVPNTRKHTLEPYRHVHPVVGALLDWRRDERIATTYGYRWLDTHVGDDDRLRGRWEACDGAAGRMTAESGLHNLPVSLRAGVAAGPGHALVRADLGQIEPRVLAAVSGDAAFAAATAADDLYAPVAARLGVDRATAKVAVLAAMYGQRSGAAGEALSGLERAYPVAMALLDRAYAAGVAGHPVRTVGGRLVPTDFGVPPAGTDPVLDAARGRFARNALIQGAAAELFKAWAATVRVAVADLGASIVLCLHDELLVHAGEGVADEVAARVRTALAQAARRWAAGAPVRFVAEVSVVQRWSQATH